MLAFSEILYQQWKHACVYKHVKFNFSQQDLNEIQLTRIMLGHDTFHPRILVIKTDPIVSMDTIPNVPSSNLKMT